MLVHCLAGAHRAGTTGCSNAMPRSDEISSWKESERITTPSKEPEKGAAALGMIPSVVLAVALSDAVPKCAASRCRRGGSGIARSAGASVTQM